MIVADAWEEGFRDPPPDARPMVYWVWLNGNVTAEGITADLEAMQRVGIGEVLVMNGGVYVPDGPVTYLTDRWRELLAFAATEVKRLEMRMSVFNSDGFSLCGGPWVTPELAMKKLVWTETSVSGPAVGPFSLPQPPANHGLYGDIAVVAYRVPPARMYPVLAEPVEVPNTRGGSHEVCVDLGEQVTVSSLVVDLDPGVYEVVAADPDAHTELQASTDGRTFTPVTRFLMDCNRHGYPVGTMTAGFDAVTARWFRPVFRDSGSFRIRSAALRDDARVHSWELKAGLAQVNQHGGETTALRLGAHAAGSTAGSTAAASALDVTDLTGRVRDNVLDWTVPGGEWVITRIGYTATGKENHPASSTGRGLECDKLDPAGVELVLARTAATIVDDLDPDTRSVLRAVHSDSYEAMATNWSASFADEFRRRRGYDLVPWLPVLTSGRVVGDRDRSDRFLRDFRRTIADLYADHYLGRHHELAGELGLEFQSESCGRQQYMYDPLTYMAACDVPMGEFWLGSKPYQGVRSDCRAAASVAHTHGRTRVAAEAFTAFGSDSGFTEHPGGLKRLGDAAFCAGVNQFVLHRYVHQPWDRLRPGLGFGEAGIHVERTNTWWEQSRGWMRYLARCQWMLCQGQFVADILHYLGDDVPSHVGDRDSVWMPVPDGRDFDACTLDILLSADYRDGALHLPNGMRYEVLLLPDARTMRPEALRKVHELVLAGATVIGPRPLSSPSLEGFPACDAEVATLAEALWGPCDGSSVRSHAVGVGRVVWGLTWDEVFAELGCPPDVRLPEQLAYLHRRTDDRDVYFVSNQSDEVVDALCGFRVDAGRAELWDPETGAVLELPSVRDDDLGTAVPLRLDPGEAFFVVFPRRSGNAVGAVLRDGVPVPIRIVGDPDGGRHLDARHPGVYAVPGRSGPREVVVSDADLVTVELTGPWTVRLPAPDDDVEVRLDTLIPLNEHEALEARHAAGQITYQHEFVVPEQPGDAALLLDLGDVREIAEVTLNGTTVGLRWHPPFTVDVSGVLRAGPNKLTVTVTTTWVNRLIADAREPDDVEWADFNGVPGVTVARWPDWLLHDEPRPTGRRTFTTWRHYRGDEPLRPAGLIGPVRLRRGRRIVL